ncbi:kinase/pyrophosphorylase [Aerococcaceae bacterium DSM 111020]|nr:kinase/pyrophosphorylase [Aerococcaceae bacterium DSM 111020]
MRPTVYILSDSVGETALQATNAALAQFPDIENTQMKRFPFVSSKEEIINIMEQAQRVNALIIATLVSDELNQFAEHTASQQGIMYHNVIYPLVQLISQETKLAPIQQAGTLHQLDDYYFNRIQAIEFAVKYDDGKSRRGYEEADIILLGISRTSKTPLSMYLANQSYKVANLPLFPELRIPKEIYEADPQKIFGLTASPQYIQNIRSTRVELMGMAKNNQYSDLDRVRQEIIFAEDLYHELGISIINIENRSIEELAQTIATLYDNSI